MIDRNEYTKTDSTCHFCGGTLWENDTHTLCEECDTSFGQDEVQRQYSRRTGKKDQWREFRENRPTYHNSGIPKCVGGFPDSYEWVKASEINKPVSSIRPDDFYN